MAMHDLGYRPWCGQLASGSSRWIVIANTGARRAWQSKWLRRMLFFAWLPALWFGVGFFIWEQSMLHPELREGMEPFIEEMPFASPMASIRSGAPIEDPVASRHAVWSWLLQSFFRYSQGLIMVLVIGIIAPPLISQDVRSRAFLLYFSRPIARTEYVLGKSATLWFYLAMITTAPALSLYVLGVLLSQNHEVILVTWDLPLRILAASAVLMLPTAALALCISSMTEESRYAGFAWFAIWIMGWFTYGMLTSFEGISGSDGDVIRWTYLSLYHTLGQVQSWIFGFADFSDTKVAAGILIVVTTVSLIILFNRVSAPMRT
jgi:ABC-2 type transport system permease protein